MKALMVIRREYLEHVRKKSFIVSTIVVPLLMLAFLAVPIVLAVFVPDDQLVVDVLDRTGEIGSGFAAQLADTLDDGRPKYVVQVFSPAAGQADAERERLVAALRAKEIDAFIDIPAGVFDGGDAEYVTRDARNLSILEKFEEALSNVVLERRLAREGMDYKRVRSLTKSVSLEMRQLTSSGTLEKKSFLSEWGVTFAFVMILYMGLLTWGIAISRGILEEKGSRVIEVLLSSLEPRDLMLGKVVGIGLAGLTQMGIWAVAGLGLSLYSAGAAAEVLSSVSIPARVFVYFLVYFLLGFVLYSSLFTMIGSICTTEQDAQQLQGMVTMPMVIPIIVLMLIIQSPNSTASVVLSLIPLFTPMIMMARIIAVEPSAWQIALSIALLLASIYLSVSFSARVFRVGILMYGKRPSLREVIRWYRAAG